MAARLRTILTRLLDRLLHRPAPVEPPAPRPAPVRPLHLCPYDPPRLPFRRPRPPVPAYVGPGTPPLDDRRSRRRHHMALLLALDDLHFAPLLMYGVPAPPPTADYPRRYGRTC